MADGTKQKMTPFPKTFYVANVMEIFERMAWYGFFALSSLYMTSPVSQGGLGFNSIERGILQGIIPFLLYLFPVITGALADRYGYRNTFLVAFAILTPAYFLLGQFTSFWGFFGAFLLVAVGAATFKPVVVGTVGRVTDDTNRGMGFGVFYTIVNVGGFVGPLFAGALRVLDWSYVFILLAVTIAINFIPTIFFYKEPERDEEDKRSLKEVLSGAQEVLGNGRFALITVPIIFLLMIAGGGWMGWGTALSGALAWIVVNLLWNIPAKSADADVPWWKKKAKIGHWPFLVYLLILAGFWASFQQIFITLPEYIRDFVDTAGLVGAAGIFGQGFVNFIASVNVQHLAEELNRLVMHYGAIGGIDEARDVFFKLVHFKVRIGELGLGMEGFKELTTTFSNLLPVAGGYFDALRAAVADWVETYGKAGVDVEQVRLAISELMYRYSQGSIEAADFAARLQTMGLPVPLSELQATLPMLLEQGQPFFTQTTQVAGEWADKYRQVNPEYIVNIDALSIVIFQILVSFVIQRWRPLPVIIVGTIVAGTGIALNSIAVTGALVVFAIIVFAFGEMIASPKSQDYVAKIAPKNKVALFMGYYFVSMALGNLFGGILSGWGYEVLAREQLNPSAMWLVYGVVGLGTAVALFIFDKTVVPHLEKGTASEVPETVPADAVPPGDEVPGEDKN